MEELFLSPHRMRRGCIRGVDFFTGEMAMFTGTAYYDMGHITPLPSWHLDKLIKENDLDILER